MGYLLGKWGTVTVVTCDGKSCARVGLHCQALQGRGDLPCGSFSSKAGVCWKRQLEQYCFLFILVLIKTKNKTLQHGRIIRWKRVSLTESLLGVWRHACVACDSLLCSTFCGFGYCTQKMLNGRVPSEISTSFRQYTALCCCCSGSVQVALYNSLMGRHGACCPLPTSAHIST